MPGRKPKPTAIKLLDGNPGHRPINKSEPQFSGTPTCPKHLDKVARAEWRRVESELAASGLLTTVDRAALAAYCSAWSRWVNAEESIQKFGAVIKSPKSGFPIQNPYVGIANTAMDQMRKFLVEFGMTPSSRSRVHAADAPTSADPFQDFMASLGASDITNDEETLQPESA
jgi:P27 family predicted phage terminase small subunit